VTLNIVLVTIGFGGTTLYVEPEGNDTSKITGYDRDDWRKYLEPGLDHIIPPGTPVVDCTVEGCDTVGYAVKGPMFGQRLAPNEVWELLGSRREWDGTFASGMADVGLDVFLAHAAHFGAEITYAGSGEAFPVPEVLPTGKADAKNTAIAYGVAVDPTATIKAVLLDTITNGDN
jgi:hypothetical protein